jgi:hypothetical protein
MPDGSIYVLTREVRTVPYISEQQPVLEDFLAILDADGNERFRISILKAFENSPYHDFIFRGKRSVGDIFHTNTVHVLDGSIEDRVPAFSRGSVLMAMNAPGVVAALDPQGGTIRWARQAPPSGHHDPQILENGHLLLFKNGTHIERSVVQEIDLISGDTRWEYHGTESRPFYSRYCGAVQRLANGKTLITESDGTLSEVRRVRADLVTDWD